MLDDPRICVTSPRPYEPPVPGPRLTLSQWKACKNPQRMLRAVCDRVSDRTLRTFAIACVRRVWNLLEDERGRRAVEAAESFVAGRLTADELAAVQDKITNVPPLPFDRLGNHSAFCAAWYISGRYAWLAAYQGSRHAAEAVGELARGTADINWSGDALVAWRMGKTIAERARKAELFEQATLLRGLVGPKGDISEGELLDHYPKISGA